MTAACYPRFEPQHLVQITSLKWTSLKHERYDGLNILSHPTAFQTLDQLTRLTRLEALDENQQHGPIHERQTPFPRQLFERQETLIHCMFFCLLRV